MIRSPPNWQIRVLSPSARDDRPCSRLLRTFQTAWVGAGSGEVPGWALSLRLAGGSPEGITPRRPFRQPGGREIQ
jgi:hypothetical protein